MLSYIKNFLEKFWSQVLDFYEFVTEEIFSWISDFFYYLFDTFLSLVHGFVSYIDDAQFSSLISLGNWSGLPSQVIYLIDYLNLPLLLAAIISAYSIRVLLNLIPSVFTRI